MEEKDYWNHNYDWASEGFCHIAAKAMSPGVELTNFLKRSLQFLPESFMPILRGVISKMRNTQSIVANIRAKSPNYIEVRWMSLHQVTSWYLNKRETICNLLLNYDVDIELDDLLWLTLNILHLYLEHFKVACVALQPSELILHDQIQVLRTLSADIANEFGNVYDGGAFPAIETIDNILQVHGDAMHIGPYVAIHQVIEDHIKVKNRNIKSQYEGLNEQQQYHIRCSFGALYLYGCYAVSVIVAERNEANVAAYELPPPMYPSQFEATSDAKFMSLVDLHFNRLQCVYDCQSINVELFNEFRSLKLKIVRDAQFQQEVQAAYALLDFPSAWAKAKAHFPLLHSLALVFASVLPGTACVESDFSKINFERSKYRAPITNVSLEGILHAKQLRALESLKDITLSHENFVESLQD